jgi:2-polyprenyl-3-methyl-5-hydroxy-6-metoxy-1,4-benzoquinol methylase
MIMSCSPHGMATAVTATGPIVEWEETNCSLCGGQNWSPLLEAADNARGGTGLWFFVVQCQDCGLCFTNPRPSPGSIDQFYPALYPRETINHRRLWHWWHPWTRWCHGPAKKHRRLMPLHGLGRLLDFGCGNGSFLERMHRQGWKVTGLDISGPMVERIQTELELNALHGTLPHPDLQPASFDVITMWHSLQHVHAPLEVLREAHRLLVPGGKLLVAVPNIDSYAFRCFGHVWHGLNLPRHLTHFAPWTLYLILHRAGFRVGPIRMTRQSSWLRSSARMACRSPEATRWHRWLKHKPLSRLATWYCYLTNQADGMVVLAER